MSFFVNGSYLHVEFAYVELLELVANCEVQFEIFTPPLTLKAEPRWDISVGVLKLLAMNITRTLLIRIPYVDLVALSSLLTSYLLHKILITHIHVKNEVCRVCHKNNIRAEKMGDHWGYSSELVCFDCLKVEEGSLSEISGHKPRKDEIQLPVSVLDKKNNKFVGTFSSKDRAQEAIDRFQQYTHTSQPN